MEAPGRSPCPDDLPFAPAAQRLLGAAHREADRLRHDYIGTEHLVLALTRQDGDAALLTRLGIDRHRVRRLMEEAILPGRGHKAPSGERPYTSRTKRSFAISAECALAAGEEGIGVEHMLMGLYGEGGNIGAEILQRCGLTPERLAAHVRRSQ